MLPFGRQGFVKITMRRSVYFINCAATFFMFLGATVVGLLLGELPAALIMATIGSAALCFLG
jgi:hypothetical protein